MNEKNSTQKKIKAKDKRSSKKAVGVVQSYNTADATQRVLHLRADKTFWYKFTDGTRTVAKSGTWSISQVRPSTVKNPMCKVQFIFGGHGGRSLYKDVKGNRPKRNEKARSRSKSLRTSDGSLLKLNRPLPKTFRRIK